MGDEYTLDFEISDPHEVDLLLRGVLGFEKYDPNFALYLFRRKAIGAMCDAHAKVEKNGLYLCSNGAEGREIIQDICALIKGGAPGLILREL